VNTVEDLKNDIIKTKTVLKQEQEIFQERVLNGLFDNSEKILTDNSDYYEKTLKSLENDYKWDDKKSTYIENEKHEEIQENNVLKTNINKTKKTNKIKRNLKKIFGL